MGKGSNVILGLGETGLSYARYLSARGESFTVLDDDVSSGHLAALRRLASDADVAPITGYGIATAKNIYVSPGVPLSLPAIVENTTVDQLHGDVQMFGEMVAAPFVAITGTNGKSTVAQLVYEMALQQLDKVALGGNIGTPCLDMLDPQVDLYVLEVSSYQLELASELAADVAVVLNLSADHLDRYINKHDYFNTKLSLYDRCRSAVINRALDFKPCRDVPIVSIGMDRVNGPNELGVSGDAITLAGEVILLKQELNISGLHNLLNVQAAIAIGLLLDLEIDPMLIAAKSFSGLKHRCELVGEINGVRYVNDSKGTNPGAMIAAVEDVAGKKNVHLIAGGVSKGADFSVLQPAVVSSLKRAYLIGEAATVIADALRGSKADIYSDLVSALEAARDNAEPGDVVLLSPGCSSFDHFSDYAARGNAFRRIVQRFGK